MIFRTWLVSLSLSCFMATGFSEPTLAPWMVIDVQGEASGFVTTEPLPRELTPSLELQNRERILVGPQSHLILGNDTGFRLWCPERSQVQLMMPYQKGLKLNKGVIKLEQPTSEHAFLVEVPHGVIVSNDTSYIVLRRQDDAAILKVDRGQVEVQQGQRHQTVKEPQKVIIDQHGVRVIDEPLLEKSRAVFDFTERPEILLQAMEDKENNKGDKVMKSDSIEDIKIRGKATDAKLVEGNADGEGEFKWASSMNLIWFLLPIAAIAIFVVIKGMKKEPEPAPSNESKEKKDQGYESDDIEVIRTGLTANDPPLVTKKETHILGDVEDGVEIKAAHPLRITGCLQGAIIRSTSDVTIESGVNGQGKAELTILGSLNTSYISEAQVVCHGSISVEKAIRNAKVACDGPIIVERKNILGGWVSSRESITTPELGSDFASTEIILGQSAAKIWKERTEKELNWEVVEELNKKAKLRVLDEWISALVIHGDAKLDQQKAILGPIETKLDPTDSTKLQVVGFRKDEGTANS